MREIKFRAWGRKQKKMFIVDLLNLKLKRAVSLDTKIYPPDWSWKWKDLKLMQFTGLLDRHGKEIYEGDVIKGQNFKVETKYFTIKKNQIDITIDKKDDVAVLSDWNFIIKHIWGSHFFHALELIVQEQEEDITTILDLGNELGDLQTKKFRGLEVIGNIYENPELLKVLADKE